MIFLYIFAAVILVSSILFTIVNFKFNFKSIITIVIANTVGFVILSKMLKTSEVSWANIFVPCLALLVVYGIIYAIEVFIFEGLLQNINIPKMNPRNIFRKKNIYQTPMKNISECIAKNDLSDFIMCNPNIKLRKKSGTTIKFAKKISGIRYEYLLSDYDKSVLAVFDSQFGDVVAEAIELSKVKKRLGSETREILAKTIFESLDSSISYMDEQIKNIDDDFDNRLKDQLKDNLKVMNDRKKTVDLKRKNRTKKKDQ